MGVGFRFVRVSLGRVWEGSEEVSDRLVELVSFVYIRYLEGLDVVSMCRIGDFFFWTVVKLIDGSVFFS